MTGADIHSRPLAKVARVSSPSVSEGLDRVNQAPLHGRTYCHFCKRFIVAQLLNHKDLRLTARYQHLKPAFLFETVNRLDKGLGD